MLRKEIAAVEEIAHKNGMSLEHIKSQVALTAEGITAVDERLTRETADIRSEMRRGFADTNALVKHVYGELHSRVSTLEARRRPRRISKK